MQVQRYDELYWKLVECLAQLYKIILKSNIKTIKKTIRYWDTWELSSDRIRSDAIGSQRFPRDQCQMNSTQSSVLKI